MSKIRFLSLFAAVGIMTPGAASAFGTLIASDGVSITASRTLVVKHGAAIQIATQLKYTGSAEKMVWLVGLPNENDTDLVRGEPLSQDVFDTLDQITRPSLTPSCNGMPTGASPVPVQFAGGTFGPTAVLATSFFPAALATKGAMDRLRPFLERNGFPIVDEDPIDETIKDLVDQNMMITAIIIDLAMLGQDRIDPIISLRYPADRDENATLALRGLMPNIPSGERANLVVWVLDDARAKIGTTRDLNGDSIQLNADGTSNYNTVLEEQGAPFQSQVFFTEYAAAINADSVANAGLSGLLNESGATFLTRLRGRIVGAALRTNLAVVEVTTQGTAPRDNFFTVLAADCAPAMADAAVEEPMPEDDAGSGGIQADMGGPLVGPDMAVGADAGTSGGGSDDDGGCAAFSTAHSAPILLFLLFLPLTLRRRRR